MFKLRKNILTTCIPRKYSDSIMDSGLAFIDVKSSNPYKLYHLWEDTVIKHRPDGSPNPRCMCLATCSKDGKISNRNLVIADVLDDGFVFFTDKRSKKVQDLSENANCAATILWAYRKNDSFHCHQIRIEGTVAEMSRDDSKIYFEKIPFHLKIRSHICHQGQEVVWDDLAKTHYHFYKKVAEEKKTLPISYHDAAYRISPTSIEFYYTCDSNIADRVLFTKKDNNSWKYVHLAA